MIKSVHCSHCRRLMSIKVLVVTAHNLQRALSTRDVKRTSINRCSFVRLSKRWSIIKINNRCSAFLPSILPYSLLSIYSRSYCVNYGGRPLTAAARRRQRRRGNQDAGGGSKAGDAGGGLVTFSRYRLERYRWIHDAIVCTAARMCCRRSLGVFTLLRNSLFVKQRR